MLTYQRNIQPSMLSIYANKYPCACTRETFKPSTLSIHANKYLCVHTRETFKPSMLSIHANKYLCVHARETFKPTLPLSSNFVSITITDDICSHIMRQKSSNVSISGPTQERQSRQQEQGFKIENGFGWQKK